MFWWKGNMVRKEDALVQNTKSNTIPYFASFWLSVSPFISLRFHFSFIRGRSQHQPLGCWEILMRCCMWKSFENYNTAAAADDDNNKVSWHLLRAYHERAPSVQFSSVAQSCPTLCNSMDCSTPGLLVHHQLPEFAQTHVHRVLHAHTDCVNGCDSFLFQFPCPLQGGIVTSLIKLGLRAHLWQF